MSIDAKLLEKLNDHLSQVKLTEETKKSFLAGELKIMLNRQETANFLGVSIAFLERDAGKKSTRQIPFVKIGKKIVKYNLLHLLSYIEQNTQSAASITFLIILSIAGIIL